MAESRERQGFFGKYTEHLDDDGNKIGESREREGFFGRYTEHTDASGNVVGESREREGLFGPYTEHTGRDGEWLGESRDRSGFFGDYIEHTDTSHDEVGESHARQGFFGPYTEHSGTVPYLPKGEAKPNPSHISSVPSDAHDPLPDYEYYTDRGTGSTRPSAADATTKVSRRNGPNLLLVYLIGLALAVVVVTLLVNGQQRKNEEQSASTSNDGLNTSSQELRFYSDDDYLDFDRTSILTLDHTQSGNTYRITLEPGTSSKWMELGRSVCIRIIKSDEAKVQVANPLTEILPIGNQGVRFRFDFLQFVAPAQSAAIPVFRVESCGISNIYFKQLHVGLPN